MNFFNSTKRAAVLGIATGLLFAHGVMAQVADTAYVQFFVNVDANILAELKEGAAVVTRVEKATTANTISVLALPLPKTNGVLFGAQRQSAFPGISSNRNGNVAVNLSAQTYKNVRIALYSVNGKRILSAELAASEAAKNISRRNVVAGVYLLSVKGTNEDAVTSRLTHGGGNLDIAVTFGNGGSADAARLAKKTADGDWTITVSADGYADTVYAPKLVKGMGNAQIITLRPTTPATPTSYTVTVSGGTGGGSYVVGATVTIRGSYAVGATVAITAGTPPTGQLFQKWTTTNSGVIFANPNSATTTFTMPASAVTVTAVFGSNQVITFTDGRDGKIYRAVEIGGMVWMAENLNYAAASSGSWCYDNSSTLCDKYGRLYDWATAVSVCPTWWHLPSRQEWNDLVSVATNFNKGNGEYYDRAGTVLKSKTGWAVWVETLTGIVDPASVGTDNFGFSALPGGFRRIDGSFGEAGSNERSGYQGNWWTASEYNGTDAYGRGMSNYHLEINGMGDDGVGEGTVNKSMAFSVRCVRDDAWDDELSTVQVIREPLGGGNVSVNGINNSNGTLSFTPGTSITITATANFGYTFNGWTAVSGALPSGVTADNATIMFSLSGNVIIQANFTHNPFIDDRDGKVYRVATIGGKTWMAENLNYQTSSGSECYNDKPDSCTKYGRLYNWSTAMGGAKSSTANPSKVRGVCPESWHLPSRAEWGELAKAAGGTGSYGDGGMAGTNLKSTSGWTRNGYGTDKYGFSALPGGGHLGSFSNAGSEGFWWTATEYNGSDAYFRIMYDYYNDKIVEENSLAKKYGFSVRCVKDN